MCKSIINETKGYGALKKCLLLFIVMIVMSPLVFAADKSALTKSAHFEKGTAKITKMHARGKVVKIQDDHIIIERKVKGVKENMRFELNKPMTDVSLNDDVKIDYKQGDDKLVALKVIKIISNEK